VDEAVLINSLPLNSPTHGVDSARSEAQSSRGKAARQGQISSCSETRNHITERGSLSITYDHPGVTSNIDLYSFLFGISKLREKLPTLCHVCHATKAQLNPGRPGDAMQDTGECPLPYGRFECVRPTTETSTVPITLVGTSVPNMKPGRISALLTSAVAATSVTVIYCRV